MRRSASSATAPFTDVDDVGRQDRKAWWTWYSACIVVSLLISLIAARTTPAPFSLALLLFFTVLAVTVARPVAAIYIVVFCAMIGDPVTSGWYPFTKNLSSHESVLFVANGLFLNPLEISLGGLLLGWILGMMARREMHFRRGRMFWPIIAFSAFLLMGFVYGIAKGGDHKAAVWEIRNLMVLPVLYIVLTNLFTRRRQYQRLYWFIMVAVFINSIIALLYERTLSAADLAGLESLVAHGSTLPMNAMIVLIAAAYLFRSESLARRLLLPLLAVPVVIVFFISERRAAVVALIGGLILLGIMVFWTNRSVFLKVAPLVLIAGALYTAAFWNDSTGTAGFPAQAIKSVIAPDQVSERNQSSDVYRVVEKIDIVATINSNPITGIGFGHPFLRPIPLPEINPFFLEAYMPHNSILWIWMKAGFGGFVAMLFLFGTALRTGARASLKTRTGDYAAITFTSSAVVLMFAIFSYVDISWDPQNMVLLTVAIAQISHAVRPARDTTATGHEPETALEPAEDVVPVAPLLSALRA